jgi:hypothetical protein
MALFKTIKGLTDVDLGRVQQNVADAFNALPAAGADPKFVTTSAAQYRVVGDETVVFVDARMTPVTVVLPTSEAAGGTAPVIKRTSATAQKVTIQAPDRALIDGAQTFDLIGLAAVTLLFDGSAWWSV